jgi:alpha-mannosidase
MIYLLIIKLIDRRTKRLQAILFCSLVLLSGSSLFAQDPGNPNGYLKGYYKTIKGEDFGYHSPQPNVTTSMLIRSTEKSAYAEWETEPVPQDLRSGDAKFILVAAIDVNKENPHKWEMFVNGKKEFTISSPEDGTKKRYSWSGPDGYRLDFNVTTTDQFGDQHGYMILTAPEGRYEKGKPLTLKVEGESANSQTWFMIFKYGMQPDLNIVEEQAVTREGNNQFQQVRVEYIYMGEATDAVISSGDLKTDVRLDFGYNAIRAKLPVVKSAQTFPVSISLKKNKQLLASKNFTLVPVVPRTIHLLHHSHVDIGYTHVQDDVKQIQWLNIENAVKLASETQNYPEGERFKWNSEVMWPIESYLREQSPEKVKIVKDAISKGWIELDAFYANTLTELCSSAELVRLTADARRIAAECGTTPKAAMISDIPGWSWGIVPVLAKSGVRYLSLGTNSGDRIGNTIKEWGDRPFWWVSPSGEEKILCWIHQKGYSFFHTGLKYDELKFRLDEGKIFAYMNELYNNNYPYEIVALRYNIGSDNGPTDPTLSDAVKAWNIKYVTPTIKIMTVSESFSEFEKRYGDRIPSVSGAFTGYWEDGAASTALETSWNRKAASEINSAGTMTVMNNNTGNDVVKTSDAWRNVLLYDEHTWGSWNSISDPENPFTLSQWANKRQFAVDALKQANDLLSSASGEKDNIPSGKISRIEVINTHSWEITDMVSIPASMNITGTKITGSDGKIIPSQRLSSGEVVFIAVNIPAFGSRIYSLEKESNAPEGSNGSSDLIENDLFRLKINDTTGSAESLVFKKRDIELVDRSKLAGLNTYIYVEGRMPLRRYYSDGAESEITEKGPVTTVMKVTATGHGSKGITSYYQLINGLEKVVVVCVIDKEKIYTPEGVHLAFPFNVPAGVIHIALGYGIYRPEADQIRGACKNYFTPEKWVDISDQNYGITWITDDAPVMEIGDVTTDANAYGWVQEVKPSQTILSYVMNNYWGTNYKAGQEGKASFRYVIHPHGLFVSADAERLAAQESEPLLVIPASADKKEISSLFTVKSSGVQVTSLVPEPDGCIIHFFNAGGSPSVIDLAWREMPKEVFRCDFDGNRIGDFINGEAVPAWGIRTIRVRR